jgi:tRNA threonylcarbamoyladenosine biosynthesis protein TsaE
MIEFMADCIRFKVDCVEETIALGQKLGALLQKGDCVCLTGDLGTGKTAFTGGIAKSLEIDDYITSPTFTIVNEYEGRLPLYHFDVYRISDASEMLETGYDEYISGDGIKVIEWAELISEILPDERIDVIIEKDNLNKPDSRTITMKFHGERYKEYERRFTHEGVGN